MPLTGRAGQQGITWLLSRVSCRWHGRTVPGSSTNGWAFVPLMGHLKVARRDQDRPQTRPRRVPSDEAHYSSAIEAHLLRRDTKATIAEPVSQARHLLRLGSTGGRPPAFDPVACEQRNTVERAFGTLRQNRAVASLARNCRRRLDQDPAP
jgi:hypothetical protein